jgi:hypothetical protein
VLGFAGAAAAAWIAVAAVPQGQQQRRHRVESLLRAGRVSDALAEMSRHERRDYPPIWDPPPRQWYGDQGPPWTAVRQALTAPGTALWVREVYFDKSWRNLARYWFELAPTLESDREQLLIRAETYRRRIDEDGWAAFRFHAASDPRLSPDQRARLQAVLDAHEREDKPAR